MGFSYARKAGMRLAAISNACIAQTGSNNTFEVNGKRYFFEETRKSQADGSIRGTLYRFVDETHATRAGSFCIDKEGKVVRGPSFFKSVPALVWYIDHPDALEVWQGEATSKLLEQRILEYAKTLQIGGVNYHLTKARGFIPYPTKAAILNMDTNEIVVEWKAAMFQVW